MRISTTRSLGGPPGPNFYLVALRAGLTSAEILSPTDGPTDGPTNKAILGVGYVCV